MKKNSFKRFLAVTLAAATALTFAPVSTLGLSGVVQAQAAASTTVTGITAPSTTSIKYGSSDTLDFTVTTSADEKFSGTTAADIDASVQSVNSDGLAKTATATDYKITTVADSKAIKTHTVKVAPTDTTSLPVGNYQLVVTITVGGASKTFTSPFTVAPKSYTKITAPTGDGDLDIDLNGSTDAETGEFSIIYPEGKAAAPTALASTDVPNAFGVTFTDKDGKDATSEFTVAAKATGASSNTTTATASADGVATTYFVVKANNAATGTYTMNVAGSKTASIVVYDSSNDVETASTTSNGTVAGAAFSDVTNSKATLALTNGKITSTESGQEKTWTIGTTVKFALAPIGTAATSISSYLSANKIAAYSTNSNASTIVTANNSSLSYGKLDKYGNLAFGSVAPAITVPSDTAEGTYQVELLVDVDGKYATANVSFTVSASNNNNNNNNNGEISNTSASTSDVFGGITTDILATDNTSYSLVESGAYFVLNGTRYTANQLHWYLTTAPNATPKNMGFTQGAATITESATGKLDITVNNATQFASDVNGKAHIVGIYESGSQNTIVYNHPLTVTPKANMVTKKYSAGTISKKLSEVNDAKFAEKFLDSTDFYGVNNKYLNGANSTIYPAQSVNEGRNFSVTFNDAAGATDKPAKDSVLKVKTGNTIPADGVYYEKYYVVYEDTSADAHNNGKFVAEITVNVSVNAGPQIKVKSGDFTFSSEDNDPNKNYDNIVVDLDLTTNKTFDLKPYLYSNMSGTTYDYAPDTQNVSVKDGVVTAVSVGTAAVKITPTADGVKGKEVYVFFRVNKNAKDTITVEGKDGDKADVLTTRQYASAVKNNKISDEEDLAKAQLGYIQIEVNGKETEDKKEALKATSKGAGTLTYSLPNTVKGVKIDSKTGEITIAHDRINPNGNGTGFTSFTFPVKVVSSGSASSALTTGYFYVVVDYPDANIEGLEKSYTVGTSLKATDGASWLDLSVNNKNSKVSANVPTGSYDVTPIYKSSELDDSKLYDDDDQNAFDWYNEYYLRRATVENKTEHVLVSASDSANRIGNTYRIAEIKSVPGKTNYVTKIVNVADGKTIYEADGATSGAAITINKKTVVKVSVAYAPDASLNAKDDPAFTIDGGDDDFNHNTTNVFVAATENPKTYEVTLVPSMEGTQVIYINPTQARLSKTDYSLVDTDYLAFAVKYDTKAASATPAKVTGLKVTNAKGAKVTVKFNKVTTYPTMRYYVQKKIGKKTGGKSVGSTKTTLSVKKGATIKVRVKAYYYDENGTKHVGKYSAWKTLKTDKK